MNKKEYINEETNKKTSNKLRNIAIGIILISVFIGASIIIGHYIKNAKYNSDEAIRNRMKIDVQIAKLEEEQTQEWFENKKSEKYYELEYKIEALEKEKKQGEPMNGGYMFGIVLLIWGFMISMPFIFLSKQREIVAYQVGQTMPIAQEGIEKMAPSFIKIGKEGMEEMAPSLGKVAKEIKKGLEDEE